MLNLEGFLVQTITSTTITALLVTALGWLARGIILERLKSAIQYEYASKLEVHKGQIQAEANLALEKVKAQLQMESGLTLEQAKSELSLDSKKNELRFARMNDKRAEVIGKTYEQLKMVEMALLAYTAVFEPAGGSSRESRRKHFAETYKSFHDYVETTAIYLPKDTAERIVSIDTELSFTFFHFFYAVDLPSSSSNESATQWQNIDSKLRKPIKEALESIADDLRRLIGAGET